ncbi:hypothetical protein [Parabacteroides leei]|jgi:hypothetical protein|uniref:hypothetical protein n=1 Tax=Parabacteroides leei TaxID=2939491 RepID=UPI00189A2B80|nr:hypothetical protein [Parabacteroides goldsteinii]
MKSESQLLLKIHGEGDFIEIYQNRDVYIFHSDETALKEFLSDEDAEDIKFEKYESFSSLEAALLRINIEALRRGIITYINPDNEFVIKLLIHQRVKDL